MILSFVRATFIWELCELGTRVRFEMWKVLRWNNKPLFLQIIRMSYL